MEPAVDCRPAGAGKLQPGRGGRGVMKNERALAIAAFVTVCIVWGTTYLGIRVAVQSIPPVLLTGIRYTLAGIVLVTLLRLRGERIPRDPRTLANITVVAVLLIGGGNSALVWAEHWVPSGLAALLVATAPFWAAILEAVRRDGERMGLRGLIGMTVGFAGVALLVTPGGANGAFDSRFLLGALVIQIGAIAWQGGSVHAKRALAKVPPLMSAALQSLIGGVLLDVVGLAIGEAPHFHPTARSLIALAYLTVFGSIIAYSAYTYALAHIPMTTMPLYAYVNPIVAVILGWLILGEQLTWISIVAMVIILSGMAIVQLGGRRQRLETDDRGSQLERAACGLQCASRQTSRRVRLLLLALGCLAFLSATWTPGDLPFSTVADVDAHPRIAALVFASTSAGIYRSADAGRHWQRVSDASLYTLPFVPVHALAFNPFDDRELCALGDSSLSCTSDLGTSWSQYQQPGLTFLLFDPTARDRMFMGTPYGTDWLYVSSDHARTWAARGSFDVHPWFHGSAAIEPRTGSLLETGSPHGGCSPVGSIFRSDDAGVTWHPIVAEEDAWTLAVDRAGRTVLYVVTAGSMSASTNLGATFEPRGSIPAAVNVLASDPNNAATIYAAGDGGVVLQSVDGGRNWRRIDQSQISDRVTHLSVGSDGAVYAATQYRVFALSGGKRRRAAAR